MVDNNFKKFSNKATFIAGYPKSGTTLLLSLLDNHPQLVVVPEETLFFDRVRYSDDKVNT
jgi:hypothetical protein